MKKKTIKVISKFQAISIKGGKVQKPKQKTNGNDGHTDVLEGGN